MGHIDSLGNGNQICDHGNYKEYSQKRIEEVINSNPNQVDCPFPGGMNKKTGYKGEFLISCSMGMKFD
jgi:hypothetical protein